VRRGAYDDDDDDKQVAEIQQRYGGQADAGDLTYGEFSLDFFCRLLDMCSPRCGCVPGVAYLGLMVCPVFGVYILPRVCWTCACPRCVYVLVDVFYFSGFLCVKFFCYEMFVKQKK